MPLTNRQLIYTNPPKAAIDPSLSGNGTFTLKTATIPDDVPLKDNQVLVRIHYLALEPAMRQWLTAKRSYIAPVEVGSVMRGQSIAQILRVSAALAGTYRIGEWVAAHSGWQEYAVLPAKAIEKITIPAGCQPTDALSVLGMTGLTAYFGMTEVGRPQRGDTVVVSGAAGATGMVAGQIARIQGAKRVIGIAGSADKCRFLREELGFDAAINYRDTDWRKQLKEATPDFIDVYYDNVGGEILDACLFRAAKGARFVICGAISQYNVEKPQGPKNYLMVISQRITMRGFIVFDYADKYEAALRELGTWLSQGKIKRKEHIVKGGLETTPNELINLFKGVNTGKMMVEVVPESEAIKVDKAKL
ncbi:NADP-dependent leukotriene B4 12-hydroxydehydrogenase [Aspergillus uvarum CBS 121591]|uniref:NADP-dependent leukotriene B4 12-hydroxydehydrogenase n=1 Tax=Aspergillus uvarum CBS 121591 TaxID=1448315 RepID=A0A319C422_9EURO|nr:NADP-dependent leukotriene B4 12-hydroxydehydrogenase [Aspergillus uvarum CBS 121591]PYH78931.1 NADP-dependent leukotriene B4 12-hydroxydehydrogenase [Aspergillus uvarum CBS 121591]